MKLSIHKHVRGKPVSVPTDDRPILTMNGVRVNLGQNWMNIDCSWDDAFSLITTDGVATSSELISGRRREGDFVSRQLVMIDVDKVMTIPQLFQHPFYEEFGAGFYTSPSHTDDNHRFRIMFVLEHPVMTAHEMVAVHKALLTIFPLADAVCKDATRVFYGTIDCILKEKRDKVIPDDVVGLLINEGMVTSKPSTPVANTAKTTVTGSDVNRLLTKLKGCYNVLDYQQRRDVTWAICNELSGGEALQVMQTLWPDHDYNGKYKDMIGSFVPGKISLGTIMHMIRMVDPSYRKKNQYLNEDTTINYFNKKRIVEL